MLIQLPVKNYPKQKDIFNSTAPFVMVKKGRRAGFTKGAANNTMRVALNRKKKKGLWVDTVNANIERYVDRFFIPALRLLPPSIPWKWQKQQKILHIDTFYMDFRSAEHPENIEGFGYDYMILNEAGIILKDPYLWANAILPMTWDSDCQVFIGGTPKGGGGVFEELYRRGLDPLQTKYESYYINGFDNPYVPDEKLYEDMKTLPERVIKQEIYGEFLDDSGIVFRGVKDVAVLDPTGKQPEAGHIYVIGADLAKLEDFTVITVYDRANNEQVMQMRFNHIEWPFIRSKIAEVSRKYNKALVVLDSTGVGEPTYDDLSRMNIPIEPFKFTNTSKKQIIEKLANWIELRNIKMLQLEETIKELSIFTYDYSEKTDRVYYGAPPGFHDDIVIAHALAIYSLSPIIPKAVVPVLSPLQRDFRDKMRLAQESEGGDDYGEYEDDGNYYPEAT